MNADQLRFLNLIRSMFTVPDRRPRARPGHGRKRPPKGHRTRPRR